MADDDVHEKTIDDEYKSGIENSPEPSKKFNWFIASALVLLISVYQSNILSWYIQRTYIPDSIITHYIKNPLVDVSLKIPVYYDAEYKFPDLPEAIDYQITSRMQNEFNSLVNITFELQHGKLRDFNAGDYPKDQLFVSCVLSDTTAIQVDGSRSFGELFYDLQSVNNNDFPFFLTQLIVDHCYKSEVEKYTADKFYLNKFTDENYFVTHEAFENHSVISKLTDKNADEPVEIKLHYHVVAHDLMNIDIRSAIVQHTVRLLNSVPDSFRLSIGIDEIPYVEPMDSDYEMMEEDESFPSELSRIPILKDLFMQTSMQELDSTETSIHLVLYPFLQGGENIKSMKIEDREMYSETENTYLRLGDWGSVYFVHLDQQNEDGTYSIRNEQMTDCMWSFNEAMLDIIGVPSEVLSVDLRMEGFKRYMTVLYLTRYSTLLHKLKDVVDSHNLPLWRIKLFAESFVKTLKTREIVVERLAAKDTSTALSLAESIVHELKAVLEKQEPAM